MIVIGLEIRVWEMEFLAEELLEIKRLVKIIIVLGNGIAFG